MNSTPEAAVGTSGRSYRYLDFISCAFVTILLCSNIIGASKVATLGGVTFAGGILFFPLSYVFGDVLTEVYGYARARRVVWSGLVALIFASVMSFIIVELPPAQGWEGQEHLKAVFGQTPRIAFSSMLAYFCGEFANSFVLAKMKVLTEGKHLWARTIGSTVVGEAVDSLVFYPLAFLGVWSVDLVLKVMVVNYLVKVLWEAVLTPVTYRVVSFLKKREGEDYFDRHTQFTPFSLKAE